MRVGTGFDAHALEDGQPLILGGIELPFERGLVGHSDGDVLLHAVIDAILGAASLGDIGTHFPSENAEYKDISSLELLHRTVVLLNQANWKLQNLDATIIAECPKLASRLPEMRQNIAVAVDLELEKVSVKAKTTDGLGFTGRGEGMASYAVVSILQI